MAGVRTLVLLLLCSCAGAHEEEIRSLVRQLGDDDYRARERAQSDLESYVRRHGQEAFAVLESHEGKSADLEVRTRVQRLVDKLGRVQLLWWRREACSLLARPGVVAHGAVLLLRGDMGLVALDPRDGEQLWAKVGIYYKDIPGVHGDVVYAARPSESLAAYRVRDGRPLWSHALADVDGDSGRTRRVYRDGKGPFTEPVPLAKQTDQRLSTLLVPGLQRLFVTTPWRYCIGLSLEGKRLWVADVGSTGGTVTTPPCVTSELGLVFTGGMVGEVLHLCALRAADGSSAWKIPMPGLNDVGPRRVRDHVFVTGWPRVGGRWDGRLYAYDAKTGRQRWMFRPEPPPRQGARPTEIVETDRDRGHIRTGYISHPGDETWLFGTRLVAGGTILITENRTFRYGLRVEDGKALWRQPVGETWISSVEHGGRVYGGSHKGELLAFDPRTGAVVRRIDLARLRPAEDVPKIVVQRGHLPAEAELGRLSVPCFLGDVCYLAAASGWVMALRLPPFTASSERGRPQ